MKKAVEFQVGDQDSDIALEASRIDDSMIRRKVIIEALQRPITSFSIAACIAFLLYLVLISPIYGGGVVALTLTIIAWLMACVSFARNYGTIQTSAVCKAVKVFEDNRRRIGESELEKLRKNLRYGFLTVASTEGTVILASLNAQYVQLRLAFENQQSNDLLAMSILPALADEVYRRGLDVLSNALELCKVMALQDPQKLGQEITNWETRDMENDIKTKQERIEMHERLQITIEQLFRQARRCQFTLTTAHVELITARADGSRASVDTVVSGLQETIQLVKEVQDELNRNSQ